MSFVSTFHHQRNQNSTDIHTDSPLDEQTGDLDLLSPDGGVERVVVVVGDQLEQLAPCGVAVQEKLDHVHVALHDGVVEAAAVAPRP